MRLRKGLLVGAAVLASLLYVARAELDVKFIDLALGASSSGSVTFNTVEGYIEEINVLVTDVSDGSITGNVTVAVDPVDSTVSEYTIATNGAVAGSARWRPRVDGTSAAGADLTSDPPGRYPIHGETIKAYIHGSPTATTWRVRIKTSDN